MVILNIFEVKEVSLPSFDDADSMSNPDIVAHFVHPSGAEWWVVSGEEQLLVDNRKEFLLFGMAKIEFQELGLFTLSELLSVGAVFDDFWEVKGLYDVFPDLKQNS